VCYTHKLCFKVLDFKDIQSETVAWLLACVKSSSASRSLFPPPHLRRTLYSFTQYLLLRQPLYHRCHACNSFFCALHSYSRFLLAPWLTQLMQPWAHLELSYTKFSDTLLFFGRSDLQQPRVLVSYMLSRSKCLESLGTRPLCVKRHMKVLDYIHHTTRLYT
jgi:hypothetical protein